MNILRRIFNRSDRHAPLAVIDHLVSNANWRKRKLGGGGSEVRPTFKCAGDDLPHETILASRDGANSQRNPGV